MPQAGLRQNSVERAYQRPSEAAITSAGSSASKSSGTCSLPFIRPEIRFVRTASVGVSSATSLPAFASQSLRRPPPEQFRKVYHLETRLSIADVGVCTPTSCLALRREPANKTGINAMLSEQCPIGGCA